jgi:hypothetical protein
MAGVLLLVAGVAKLFDAGAVAPLLRGIGVPEPLAGAARAAVPWMEIGAGAWLLSGLATLAAAAVACALAGGFVGVLLLASARGAVQPCRCYGALDRAQSHRLSVARALLLLGACALAAAAPARAPLQPEWWLGVLLALCTVMVFALLGEVVSFRRGVLGR